MNGGWFNFMIRNEILIHNKNMNIILVTTKSDEVSK